MSWIGELVAGLLGDLLGASLSPSSSKKSSVVSGGEWNGSLGALSCFFGTLALLFGLLTFPLAVFGPIADGVAYFCMLAFASVFAYGALRWGQRAPHVTNRHLALARIGVAASIFALPLSLLGLVIAAARLVVV